MKNSLPNDVSITSMPYDNPQNYNEITLCTSSNLLDEMIKLVPSGSFVPYAFYNEPMNAIQVYFKNDSCYTQPINEAVELYLSHDNDEVVGLSVLNIKKLLDKKISP
jgi:hypothetical protein